MASCPEVVVIDIIMPEKDGLAVIGERKEMNSQAKVVAISGGWVLTAANIGIRTLVMNPFSGRECLTLASDIFDGNDHPRLIDSEDRYVQ